jgi:hypothetical protein
MNEAVAVSQGKIVAVRGDAEIRKLATHRDASVSDPLRGALPRPRGPAPEPNRVDTVQVGRIKERSDAAPAV